MSNINRVNIAELQKLNGKEHSGAALKSAIYFAGASYREAKDLFSGANVWENFKLELDKDNQKQEQAERKRNLAVVTATTIGLTVLRNKWNDRKDLNLGLLFEDLPKGTADLTLLKKNYNEEGTKGEIPIWDEIRTIYKENAKSGEDIAPDHLKKLIEKLFQNQRRNLHPSWWEETKKIIRNESGK